MVKRIDSSFHAFKQSLKRFSDATDAMVKMYDNGKIYIAPNLGVTEFILEDREEALLDLIIEKSETDPTIEICVPSDFKEGFIEGLRYDKKILNNLVDKWATISQDPKFDVFSNYLASKFFDSKENYEQKLVVFLNQKKQRIILLVK
ncbi:MAG: hypothetical protein M5T52_24420 [Ignavibacteriaceae bacterium]|nr:hypothetical protein [Ignavibacteriaceae bacterium]